MCNQCILGKCYCKASYTADDCSVHLRVPPKGVGAAAELEASMSEANQEEGVAGEGKLLIIQIENSQNYLFGHIIWGQIGIR